MYLTLLLQTTQTPAAAIFTIEEGEEGSGTGRGYGDEGSGGHHYFTGPVVHWALLI